ncbi:hypothetical protein [Polaromonas naphthalenivorans]|uniref:hypothetical protein n=1 Tax=Polaromonas naphthalenivorans TaxID=216465 RepID=UPI001E56A8E4|nr:hypothetical protein [Polaromonas naphthalenivorans]
MAKARRAQARRRLDENKEDKAVLDLSGDLAAAKAERDRPPVWAAGIDPRSYYHPGKVAARQAAQPTPAPQVKRAAAAGVADLRTPFQRSRQEAAQQAAHPHQEDQDNPGQAERMSAAELRAEIARLRPPPLREVVERQPELVTARQSSDTLAEQWRQAQAMAAEAGRELENWRSAHPVRAKAHDSGLMRAAVLVETEQRRQEAEAQRQRLAPRVEAATEHLKRTRSSVEERVKLEQAQALAKVAELERIERQRQDQEQADRAKAQELDEVLSAFKGHALKRETKSLGYGDTGQQWNAIPEPLRKVIEDFNRLPQEARPVVLERMRENMQRDPQGVETFRQGLQSARGNDRGMSR